MAIADRHTARMTLSDLLDIEIELAHDRDRSAEERLALDGDVRRHWSDTSASVPRERGPLLTAWARTRHAISDRGSAPTFGAAMGAALAAAVTFGVVAAAAAGWGAGSLMLSYDAGHPVNALAWLAVCVGLPFVFTFVAAVLWLVGLRAARAAAAGSTRVHVVGALLRWLTEAWLSLAARWSPRDDDWRAAAMRRWHTVRARESLYRATEARSLFATAQWIALTFQLVLTLNLVVMVATTDLAFRWGSTLDGGAELLQAFSHVVAAPWWYWDAATLDAALIDGSRYSRIDAAYVAPGGSAASTGRWWVFLFAASLHWVLLPRLVLAVAATRATRSALRDLSFDDPAVDALVHRLTAGAAFARGDAPPESGQPEPSLTTRSSQPSGPRTAVLLRWAGAERPRAEVNDAVGEQLGWALGAEHDAGTMDRGAQDAAIADVGAASAALIVADGWDMPVAEFGDLLDRIRALDGSPRAIVVALSGGSEADRRAWEHVIASRRDPHLTTLSLDR